MTSGAPDLDRFERVRSEWRQMLHGAPIEAAFERVKREAAALVDAGLWTSGAADMLTVLGRQRDELVHSRMIGWLMVPTNRHGLGRAVLTAFLDALWPGESLMRSGPVVADLEVPASGVDDTGRIRDARADIVIRGDGVTVVIENKVDAGEQPEQCERLYWAWAGESGDVRWVFLTPTGRPPATAASETARSGWKTIGYRELRTILARAIEAAGTTPPTGRSTALQYLETLGRSVAPRHE